MPAEWRQRFLSPSISILSRDAIEMPSRFRAVILRTAKAVEGPYDGTHRRCRRKDHHRGKQHRRFYFTTPARPAPVGPSRRLPPTLRMTVHSLC